MITYIPLIVSLPEWHWLDFMRKISLHCAVWRVSAQVKWLSRTRRTGAAAGGSSCIVITEWSGGLRSKQRSCFSCFHFTLGEMSKFVANRTPPPLVQIIATRWLRGRKILRGVRSKQWSCFSCFHFTLGTLGKMTNFVANSTSPLLVQDVTARWLRGRNNTFKAMKLFQLLPLQSVWNI